MKKFGMIVLMAVVLLTMAACTEQGRAKKFGGEYEVELPKGEKLVNMTFKDSDIWYLTKPMTDEDVAETYTFKEDSTWGLLEGTVTVKETK